VKKKRLLLSNGLLELTELWDGRLVLGEIRYGSAKKSEMRGSIYKSGIRYGLIESNLALLESGHKGQIPLAKATLEEDPGKAWFHFEDALNESNFSSWLKHGSFDNVDFSYPVKADERLMSLTQRPFRYLRYPNGEQEFISDLADRDISIYAGENTYVNDQGTAVHAVMDGYAHRTIYGTVSVYPERRVKNIGKMHGAVEFDNTLIVEQDIRSGSRVTLPSNLIVNGMIRSSHVHVAGNITCSFGFDNQQMIDHSTIYAGQSILAGVIKDYPVWAGMFIFVRKKIDHATVQAINSIVAPVISASEIRVGCKLYTRTIENRSHIYLGPDYVVDPNLKNIKNYHRQHEKKLFDSFIRLDEKQLELEFTKKKALQHLAKLNKMSRASISSDVMLGRFFVTMEEELKALNDEIEKCRSNLSVYQEEQRQLSFYEQQTRTNKQPEIIVTGRIEPGCVIYAPHHTLRVHESLEHVSITLDPVSGILNVSPLKD